MPPAAEEQPYLDFMNPAEAVPPEELDQVGQGAGSGHLLQALGCAALAARIRRRRRCYQRLGRGFLSSCGDTERLAGRRLVQQARGRHHVPIEPLSPRAPPARRRQFIEGGHDSLYGSGTLAVAFQNKRQIQMWACMSAARAKTRPSSPPAPRLPPSLRLLPLVWY